MVSRVVKTPTTWTIFFSQSGSVFVKLTMQDSILLSSTKQSIQVFRHFTLDSIILQLYSFHLEAHIKLLTIVFITSDVHIV